MLEGKPEDNPNNGTRENADVILDLIEILNSVDIKSTEAKLNETTISDSNGGRIVL